MIPLSSEKLKSFKILWEVPRDSRKFRGISENTMFSCSVQVPRDFTELQEFLESSEIFQGVLGGFKIFLRVFIER